MERVLDISRLIGLLEDFDFVDNSRIVCMGNSAGGTATFYAACIDERIKIAFEKNLLKHEKIKQSLN